MVDMYEQSGPVLTFGFSMIRICPPALYFNLAELVVTSQRQTL